MRQNVNAALRLVAALDDPLRLTILRRLMAGPATVSELIAHTGAAQSKVSNHLALLREARVVACERLGRHVTYGLASSSVASVIEAIEAATEADLPQSGPVPQIALARSCYDHVAGRLGVEIFRVLVERGALRVSAALPERSQRRPPAGDVRLGPRANAVFSSHGLDLATIEGERRRFATACNDWTEARPHLGGALGAAFQRRMLQLQWLQRRAGTRALRVTPAGRNGFFEHFAIDFRELAK